jgi:hypothetical protein
MKAYNLLLLILLFLNPVVLIAQNRSDYRAPRNASGQPDFQGGWEVKFATMLERPDGVEALVMPREQARELAARLVSQIPHNEDPDFAWQNVMDLALVNGEYRTSLIVDPDNGKLPYRESALLEVEYDSTRYQIQFDHPEQRPLGERCLSFFAGPPVFAIPLMFPYQIVQTDGHFILYGEGVASLRIVHLTSNRNKQEIPLTYEGYSIGHWEGETLVVETANFRADHPSRSGFGRPLLVGPDTTITERFTRVAANELNYYFTVSDGKFYEQPFSGEFSFYSHDGPIYEYGCHEGNYSLPSILRGGQMQNLSDKQ